jgi:hypothetical protein
MRVRGAYYRARILTKDRADIEPAVRLLGELRREVRGLNEQVLELQIRRLHAHTLTRAGDPTGRDLILELLEEVGGAKADAGGEAKELARFLDDLCADLTAVGAHDAAVSVAARLARRPVHPELRAIRMGNRAAWLLQRAVARRAEGDAVGAHADLDSAANAAGEAVAALPSRSGGSLHAREARAVALSIAVERSALTIADSGLGASIAGLRELLIESLPIPRSDTFLQVGYRIGRLGIAHVREARRLAEDRRAVAIARGRAYLQLAWSSSGNACVRPWLALDLEEALAAGGSEHQAKEFAHAAAARLAVQCGDGYPPVVCLRKRHVRVAEPARGPT